MCDESLRDPLNRKSIAEIAYQWGFGDQGQFGRHYRTHFRCTPSEARGAARSGAAGGGTRDTIVTPTGRSAGH
jgi:AraC-like DNA-binding protein